jgi:hypothetical protein
MQCSSCEEHAMTSFTPTTSSGVEVKWDRLQVYIYIGLAYQ